MNDAIFYFGAVIITAAFVGMLIIKFKDEDNIDLNKHKWIILLYIILLICSIITWHFITMFFVSNTKGIINYNQNIQRVING